MCDWRLERVIDEQPQRMRNNDRWYAHMIDCDECRRRWIRAREGDIDETLRAIRTNPDR